MKKLLAILLSLIFTTPVFADIAWIGCDPITTHAAATFTSGQRDNVTQHNALIMFTSWGGDPGAMTTRVTDCVTGNISETHVVPTGIVEGADGNFLAISYIADVQSTTGSSICPVMDQTNSVAWGTTVCEISGQNTSSFYDTKTGNHGSGISGDYTVSLTTAESGELVVIFASGTGAEPTVIGGSGYIGLGLSNAIVNEDAFYKINVSGTNNVGANYGATSTVVLIAAAFKKAGGTPPATQVKHRVIQP